VNLPLRVKTVIYRALGCTKSCVENIADTNLFNSLLFYKVDIIILILQLKEQNKTKKTKNPEKQRS
jgi:hypothetical protein